VAQVVRVPLRIGKVHIVSLVNSRFEEKV
jgi:hypothetical protein